MKKLYSYLMNPQKTIQLFDHQKNWDLWWLIVAVSSVINMVKWSSIGILTFIFSVIINILCLLVFSVIVDASAQCLGKEGKLKTLIYWFGFNQTVLWLMPSLKVIQHSLMSVGSILILLLNFIFIYYGWVSLNQIYPKSKKKILIILALPFLFLSFVALIGFGWVSQKVMVL